MLPEKWCILMTAENESIVGGYYDEKTKSQTYSSGCVGRYFNSHNLLGDSIVEKDYIAAQSFLVIKNDKPEFPEITFEQFRQYVLNQPVKESDYEIY